MNKLATKKMGIWCLAISLFAFHILFRSVAHADAPTSDWRPVFCKSGECSISFPTKPQIVQQNLPLSDGVHKLSYEIYLSPHEDKGVFLLLVATYPVPLGGGHEIAGLEGLLSGIVKHHSENKLVFADLVEFQDHPTIQFLVEGKNNYFRGHAFMVDNKLYLIAMEGLKNDKDETAYTKFLKSFSLKD